MKNLSKILILASVMLICTMETKFFSQGIEFKQGEWNNVKDLAAQEDKIIMMDVYADWCVPCKTMDKEVFKNDEVGIFYNANFINYKVDAEKGEGIKIAENYDVKYFPTILFIESSGKLIDKKMGYIAAIEFIETGKSVLNPDLRLSNLKEKYHNGIREPEFIKIYIKALASSFQDYEEVVKEYFKIQNESDWLTKDNCEIFLKYVNYPETREFQYFMKNREKCIEYSDIKTFNDKVYNTYGYYAYTKSGIWNENNLTIMFEEIRSYGVDLPRWFELRTLSDFYKAKAEWIEYFKVTKEYVDNHVDYTNKIAASGTLNNFAWDIYENMSDKKYLKQAAVWSKKSVELDENYYSLDTYACLLYKLGKYEEAEKYCKKAIKLGKQSGDDTKPTEDLLKKIEKSLD